MWPWKASRTAPLRGEGPGTYELQWARDRPAGGTVTDAHSLYLEVLGSSASSGSSCCRGPAGDSRGALARATAGRDRSVYAAVLAAALAWALHAGIDWDWEMPAVTLWDALAADG